MPVRRIALLSLVLLAGMASGARAQQAAGRDAFAAACLAKPKSTASGCACQSKLARANLDRREQQVALLALRGDKDGFGKQIKSMGEARAKVFSGKMQQLGERSRAECK